MSLFNINLYRFVEQELPLSRNLPKWKGFTFSIVKPFQQWYDVFFALRTKLLRFRHCDGSIISLTSLIYLETGAVVEFTEGIQDVETAYITTFDEGAQMYLNNPDEGEPATYIGTQTEGTMQTDYIVVVKNNIPQPVLDDTLRIIRALVAMYNSAGFNFEIWYKPI